MTRPGHKARALGTSSSNNDKAERTPGRSQVSALRAVIEEAKRSSGLSLNDLTVLAPANDPFRQDTDAGHRDGKWFKSIVKQAKLGNGTIHLRGGHYLTFSALKAKKPNGLLYENTYNDWQWFQIHAAKPARWLKYVDFGQVHDQRNDEPKVRLYRPEPVVPYVGVAPDIALPNADDLWPTAEVEGFTGRQPFRLAFVGEKSSLEPVLGEVAEENGCDLYLPTGECSDTHLHLIALHAAMDAAIDGRSLIVFDFSDCDPAGWQMPVSIARKLQAFKAGWFPELCFEVHRVALTPDQVRANSLPSTPLKDTERRADRWRDLMGVDQTEVDALIALRPDLLRKFAVDAIAPFYDATLDQRVEAARRVWQAEAQDALDDALEESGWTELHAQAGERLAALEQEVADINDLLRLDPDDFDLPTPVVPTHEVDLDAHPEPLISSEWDWVEQTRRLIASKAYGVDQ